ncbi:MAG: CcoQ/FixQ family Cbb3-type cytochrome c oxidase assembly chaperone [bacterium]|nr:CcoQ/FixQ family Cbb3-type cytochrome c oxidase assembly chaperone [bacterium]
MKFSTYLEKIAGVSIYPVVSLIMFFAFFAIVTLWIYSIDKNDIERLENLPLEDTKK